MVFGGGSWSPLPEVAMVTELQELAAGIPNFRVEVLLLICGILMSGVLLNS